MTDTLSSSGSRLALLINDVLDFSKIEAGHVLLENIKFDVRATIMQLLINKRTQTLFYLNNHQKIDS